MNLKHLGDSIRHTFLEDEDVPVAPASVQQAAVGQPYTLATPISLPAITVLPVAESVPQTYQESASAENPFTQHLKDCTDFNKTPVGVQVLEHLAPLEGLGLTDAQKFTVVLKAGAKDGLTAEAILKTVAECSARLQSENESFAASSAAFLVKEVESRKKLIQAESDKQEELRQKIAESQQVQNNISTEMVEAQSRNARTQAQFQVAFNTCRNDLDTTLSRYTAILKGSN